MTLYAENMNYWQTSKKASETWFDLAKKEITRIGGKIIAEVYGTNDDGRSGFLLKFKLGEDTFKVFWPVLPTRTKYERAARVQAATLLYHDVKAKCMTAKVMGIRAAFYPYLLLPTGKTASETSAEEVIQLTSNVILLPSSTREKRS